jgi:hypothetical protein
VKTHKTAEDLQRENDGLKILIGVMKNHIQRATETCIELEAMVIQEQNKTARYAAKVAELTGQDGPVLNQ